MDISMFEDIASAHEYDSKSTSNFYSTDLLVPLHAWSLGVVRVFKDTITVDSE